MSFVENIKQKLATNNAVIKIILLNVIVYFVFASAKRLFWLYNSDGVIETVEHFFVLYPSLGTFITRPWGIVTYMFFHTGFFHLLFNMLWLYWLGNLLQEYLGNKRVYQAFFLGGIFGGLLYMLSYNVFPVFKPDLNVSYAWLGLLLVAETFVFGLKFSFL